MIFLTLLILIIIALIVTNIRVVPQTQEFIIERLGTYCNTWRAGLHVKLPLIDKVANKVSMKENLIDFPPQPVITKDNVIIDIDFVVYFQVTDSKLYTYGITNPISAIENLTSTILRSIIGEMDLDQTLSGRQTINDKIRIQLDEATDAWGIRICRVEVKSLNPGHDIQEAMEKQMRAEREKREKILIAEGEKQSAILTAEGEKEAKILQADADKTATIKRAEGEAEAIKVVQHSLAVGLRYLNEANPQENVIAIKSLEAFGKLAESDANTVVIPSEIKGIAGLTSALTKVNGATKEK